MEQLFITLGCIKVVKRQTPFGCATDYKIRMLHPLIWIWLMLLTLMYPFICLVTNNKLQEYIKYLHLEDWVIW